MGTCELGQGRKTAAISSHLHVCWASRRGPGRGRAVEGRAPSRPLRPVRGHSGAAPATTERGPPLMT